MRISTAGLTRAGWGVLAVVSVLYGLYALDLAWSGLLFLLDLGPEVKHRGAPVAFTIHAAAGAVALLTGPFQFSRRIRAYRRLHRSAGYAYVTGVWLASLAALLMLPTFGVNAAAKAVFAVVAVLWIATTTLALQQAIRRNIPAHRAWMARSLALSLFFVTFSFWVPLLARAPLPAAVGYPLALALAGGLNLVAAEAWVRMTRHRTPIVHLPRPALEGVPCV